MYQGRYFGSNRDHPRYITWGPVVGTFDIHWHLHSSSRICIVEDFISAIKVSRVLNSMPMWGSSLNSKQLRHLATMFNELVWWVDPDKQYGYANLVNKASMYFDRVKCISSYLDPKEYSTEEIRCHMNLT